MLLLKVVMVVSNFQSAGGTQETFSRHTLAPSPEI